MHNHYSTRVEEERYAHVENGSDPRRSTSIHDAVQFCSLVCECAGAAAKAARIENARLVLSSYGELPVANEPGKWKSIQPRNKAFAADQHHAMAEQAVAWATEPGRNVYLSMVLYPSNVGINRRGKAVDAKGVFGLGGDLDGDKGRSIRIEDLPLPPTLVIRSSQDPAENFNIIYLFDRLMSVEEARVLARALNDLVGDADGGTTDPIHVWRVPGTQNWPKKAKVARGRPLAPQQVRLLHRASQINSPEVLGDALEVGLEDKLGGKGIAEFYSDTARSVPKAAGQSGPRWSGDHWTPDMPNAEGELQRDLDALKHISPDCQRKEWRKIVAAIADRHLGSETGRVIAHTWSLGGSIYGVSFPNPTGDYTAEDFEACWLEACLNPYFSIVTVFHFVRAAGWNSSRMRWNLARPQRPGKPLSAEALLVQEAGLAMPRKNPNLERIAWYWRVLKTTRRPDLHQVAFIIAFSINLRTGFAWRGFESIANLLGWSQGKTGEGFRRVSRAVRDLALSGLIVRSPGNERGAHGRIGPSFALTLPDGMTWDACVAEYQTGFNSRSPGTASTRDNQGRSQPQKKVQTDTLGGSSQPSVDTIDQHQDTPVQTILYRDQHQDMPVHLNVNIVGGREREVHGMHAAATSAAEGSAASHQAPVPSLDDSDHPTAHQGDSLNFENNWSPDSFWGDAAQGQKMADSKLLRELSPLLAPGYLPEDVRAKLAEALEKGSSVGPEIAAQLHRLKDMQLGKASSHAVIRSAANYVVERYIVSRERGSKLSRDELDYIDVSGVPAKRFAREFAAALAKQVDWKSKEVERGRPSQRPATQSSADEPAPQIPPEAEWLPWVEPHSIPQDYDGAIYFDAALGQLKFVHNVQGMRFSGKLEK